MAFVKATKQVAYSKIGAFGPTGSGKTTLLGMLLLYLSKELHGSKPVAFLDTEKGSDFILPFFELEGVDLLVNKTRAFSDLRNAHAEALKAGACALGADSLTHFWMELLASIKASKGTKRLDIGQIGEAKDLWHQFTENFAMSPIHYLIAGRQGNEWENVDVEQDNGNIKTELIKGGTKMKAEGDTGYETDLLLELSSADDPNAADYKKLTRGGRVKKLASKQIHVAIVKKCRVRELNGQLFSWPDKPAYEKGDYKKIAECFLPYFRFLNIGGDHVAFDGSRNSQDLFASNGSDVYYKARKHKEVTLEEIENTLVAIWPGTDKESKKNKLTVLEMVFKTLSWEAVKGKPIEILEEGLQVIRDFRKRIGADIPQTNDGTVAELTNSLNAIAEQKAEQAAQPF